MIFVYLKTNLKLKYWLKSEQLEYIQVSNW